MGNFVTKVGQWMECDQVVQSNQVLLKKKQVDKDDEKQVKLEKNSEFKVLVNGNLQNMSNIGMDSQNNSIQMSEINDSIILLNGAKQFKSIKSTQNPLTIQIKEAQKNNSVEDQSKGKRNQIIKETVPFVKHEQSQDQQNVLSNRNQQNTNQETIQIAGNSIQTNLPPQMTMNDTLNNQFMNANSINNSFNSLVKSHNSNSGFLPENKIEDTLSPAEKKDMIENVPILVQASMFFSEQTNQESLQNQDKPQEIQQSDKQEAIDEGEEQEQEEEQNGMINDQNNIEQLVSENPQSQSPGKKKKKKKKKVVKKGKNQKTNKIDNNQSEAFSIKVNASEVSDNSSPDKLIQKQLSDVKQNNENQHLLSDNKSNEIMNSNQGQVSQEDMSPVKEFELQKEHNKHQQNNNDENLKREKTNESENINPNKDPNEQVQQQEQENNDDNNNNNEQNSDNDNKQEAEQDQKNDVGENKKVVKKKKKKKVKKAKKPKASDNEAPQNILPIDE